MISNNLKITDQQKIQQISRSIDKKSRLGIQSVKELLGKGRRDESGDFTKGCELSEGQIDEVINFLKININRFFQAKTSQGTTQNTP